ncbi:MAG: tetratricopeptide repeat protein [Dissulfuribacterales bacterium]
MEIRSREASLLKHKYRQVLICLFIVASTLAVYWNVGSYEFINFDDQLYVAENSHVQQGITPANIFWAFNPLKKSSQAYWHPLTWISHMADCQLFGLDAGKHHLTSLAIHIINAILLFLCLNQLTGAMWKSAFVAALFAVHPLNVDSVAWISERKNLLSTFFWILTMMAYARYAKKPSMGRYLMVFSAMAAGLLSKPMLVTLPCVLLLLDFWPMGRINSKWIKVSSPGFFRKSTPARLVLEKTPLLVLSLASTAMSIVSLKNQSQIVPDNFSPMALRIENAIVSYIKYLAKIFWPRDMAVFYPFPHSIPPREWAGAAILLVCIFTSVILLIKKAPYAATGWFWFFGALVPVIGIIQGGRWPAMADRWTYVPAIGIFIIISWGGSVILQRFFKKSAPKLLIATTLIFTLMIISRTQASYWKNSITLFTHAMSVTKNNGVAYYNLGAAIGEKGRIDEAIKYYYAGLKILPNNERAHVNLANALAQKGKTDEALTHYQIALKLKPMEDKAFVGLGSIFTQKKEYKKAIGYYLKALKINPKNSIAHVNIGKLMVLRGEIAQAVFHFKKAININPKEQTANKYLNHLALVQKKIAPYATKISKQIDSSPDNPMLYIKLADLYKSAGIFDKAIPLYKKAVSIKPEFTAAIYNLAIIYASTGEFDLATENFKKIISYQPNNAAAYYNIACIYALQNQKNQTINWLQQALDHGYDNWDKLRTDPDLDNIKDEPYFRNLLEK